MSEINKYEIFKELKLNQDFIRNIKIFYVNYKNVLIVTNNDKAYVFGRNKFGVLGLGHMSEVKELLLNEDLSNKQIIDFKNGWFHTIARTIDGKVYCWGWNYLGLLGNESYDGKIYKPELNLYLSDKNIIDICCGYEHSLVLTFDGKVYAWGHNYYGQIGNGKNDNVSIPYLVNGFNGEKVKAIACGFNHSMVLTEKGNVFSWGQNNFGQLGFRKLKDDLTNVPKLIEIDETIDKISCGYEHSLLLSYDGDIYVYGSNYHGQLGDEEIEEKYETPLKLKNENKFIDIASHSGYSISTALSKEGIIFVWGQCGEKVIENPKESDFKSLNDIFANYFHITYKTIHRLDECLENLFSLKNKKYELKFEEKRFIASGNFGSVCEVLDKDSKQSFAIKKIQFSEDQKEKVCRETRIIAKIDAKYVVECYDFWIEENHENQNDSDYSQKSLLLYIQMELCWKSLKEVIQIVNGELIQYILESVNPFGYYIASELFIEILEGVDFLHKQNPPIIHRDLKPTNILVTHGLNGRFIKLADFGLATIHQYEGQSHSKYTGTRLYIAPEVMNSKYYDSKADVYSLGIIAQELFHIDINRPAFPAINPTLRRQHTKIAELIDKMTSNKKNLRPNCSDILKNKNSWALNLQQLKKIAQIQLNELKSTDKRFHSTFIQIKLKSEPTISRNENSIQKIVTLFNDLLS